MEFSTFYEVLGIPETATPQQVKEAYRREAMKWHPDRHDGEDAKRQAHARFKQIAEAYRTLKDDGARAAYDDSLAATRSARAKGARRNSAGTSQAGHDARNGANRSRDSNDQAQDDADAALFLEQMIDLAFELAAKGFPPQKVSAALIGLGCPESMAHAVSELAAHHAATKQPPEAKIERQFPKTLDDLDSLPWERVEPIYRAAIEGERPSKERMSNEAFNRIQKKMDGRRKVFWIGCLVSACLIFVRIEVALLLLALISSYFAITALISLAHAESRQWAKEAPTQAYLLKFRTFHEEKGSSIAFTWNPSAWIFNTYWLVYRKMTFKSLVSILLSQLLFLPLILTVGDVSRGSTIYGAAYTLIFLGYSFFADHGYYKHLRSKIAIALRGKSIGADLGAIKKLGGVSRIRTLIISLILAVIGSMQIAYLGEHQRRQQEIARKNAEAVALEKEKTAAALRERRAAEQRDAIRQRYDRVVDDAERRFTWLNPNHPDYDLEADNWVSRRRDDYTKQGHEMDVALQMAIRDAAAIIGASKR